MRKEFDGQKESFSVFSASLVAGDTAILADMGVVENRLGAVSELLRRGIVVRTPAEVRLDGALQQDSDTVEVLVRLAGAMDRKVDIQALSVLRKAKAAQAKRPKDHLETKVHQLIEERGLGAVEACRKVHCRPSDYYIYRGKLKAKSYGR